MIAIRAIIPTGLMLVALALASPVSMAVERNSQQGAQAVTYKRIGTGDYQNFLANWDEKKHPVLFALIQNPAQYAALFHPAPVMGGKRPFAPAADIYQTEQILVVARVMLAPESMEKSFEVEQITENGQELTFTYRFLEAQSKATYSVKNFLAVSIPGKKYKKINIVENGNRIGVLDMDKGQWSVPAVAETPNVQSAVNGQ
jgi:hypothetical protein